MTIQLDLPPDIEHSLLQQAQLCGVSLSEYLQEIVIRQAQSSKLEFAPRTGQTLIDASAKVRGLLTDEEVDTLFHRSSSLSRPVDLE